MNANLTINSGGSLTLSPTMTITGASTLILSTSTVTPNGKAWAGTVQVTANTITLTADWTITNYLGGSTSNTATWNGFKLYVTGDFSTGTVTSGTIAGTTEIVLSGTGTLSSSMTTGRFVCPLTINTSGTITISNVLNIGGVLTYISGTVVTTGTTLNVLQSAATLSTGAIVWNHVTFASNSLTHTLASNLLGSGTLTLGGTTGVVVLNGLFEIVWSGAVITSAITSGSFTGTATLRITNNCTVGAASITTGRISIPHIVDAAGKTVTISNTWPTDISHWKRIAGDIVTSEGDLSTGRIYSHPAMNGGLNA
jgi:hypothetical protein